MAEPAPVVVTIFPWPHFQAIIDGEPAIGGKLYTFAANTTTPKAAYLDPGFVTPHPNPIVLDDQGAAEVFLKETYHLRFTDAAGALYWEVQDYSFSPGAVASPDGFTRGSTGATIVADPGSSLLTVTGLAPQGYRITGVTSTVTVGFGTSNGLSALLLGDGVLENRWGRQATLTPGAQTGQKDFTSDTQPIAAVAYSLQITTEGGPMDATGALHVTVYWESLQADVP